MWVTVELLTLVIEATLHTAISGKVVLQRRHAYATMPKGIMGNGGFTVAWLKLKVFQRDRRQQH